jgi:hypothetical protein
MFAFPVQLAQDLSAAGYIYVDQKQRKYCVRKNEHEKK